MEKLILSGVSRDTTIKTSDIRATKQVPAVVYGHAVTPVHISVDSSAFLKLFRKAGGTHLVDLTIDGKKISVLIHETQRHPVSGDFLHVDFFAVSATETINVAIPVELIGKSQAVVEGAEVVQNLHAVDVRVLPGDLVDKIEIDISTLIKIGDTIHVSDIAPHYPKFEFITPGAESIASAAAPIEYSDELQTADIADVATVQDEKAAEKTDE